MLAWSKTFIRRRADFLLAQPSNRCKPRATATTLPSAPSSGGSQAKAPTRKLILLRHADSVAQMSPGSKDHERPISEEGKLQAASIAKELQKIGWEPDIILASNAKRTKQTLNEMAMVMESLEGVDTHLMGSLYTVAALDGQTRQHLQECMQEVLQDKSHFCVMLVGHNKGWEEAASSLAGQAVKLQAASAALLQVAADSWTDVLQEEAKWQLVGVLQPAV